MPCIEIPTGEGRAPVVVIVGPTAVGKSALAIELAERCGGGEIVSADSRYFYRGMDIGTAKPTLDERQRVPHHLIDVADPDEVWSLALFQRAARNAIAEIQARGNLPFLVGGTGQYIKSVIEEWELPGQPPDPEMRAILERWAGEIGTENLHQHLARLDPEAAAVIEPRNLRRTVRALEVIFHSGKRFSAQRRKLPSPYRILQIGLTRPRIELYRRIDERIEAMLQDGLLTEVETLLGRGYPPDLPAFSALGYREAVQVLQGELSLEEAIILMKRYTRQFVRRQANWFKEKDPEIHWFTPSTETLDDMTHLICEGKWLAELQTPAGTQRNHL
jgi:tRNA dimethylallyltransferase